MGGKLAAALELLDRVDPVVAGPARAQLGARREVLGARLLVLADAPKASRALAAEDGQDRPRPQRSREMTHLCSFKLIH